MAFVRAAVGAVVVVVVFFVGVWIGLGANQGSGAPPAPQPSLRPSELPGPEDSVTTGAITYRVLGWRCGIFAVQGDHADWLAQGQYCRVRLRMTSGDRYVHVFTAAPQTLVTTDGRRHTANVNAIQIADQPTRTEARPFAVLEFDLWFDIPRDARAAAVLLYGDDDREGARIDLQ